MRTWAESEKPQCCSLLVVLDTEECHWATSKQVISAPAAVQKGLEMPRGPRLPLMVSTVQLSCMALLWQISTEQWSQPCSARVFSYLVPTMSHRPWCLHLTGFMLKKGGHEITLKKDSLLWKSGDGEKNIILRKNKSSDLGKTPQGDNTEESQQ